MERRFLAQMGIAKDDVDRIMAANGRDIEAHKARTAAAETARDEAEAALEGAKRELAAFDGVDADALRGEAERLRGELEAQRADFERQSEQRELETALHEGIRAAGGRNPRAIAALLDAEALRGAGDFGAALAESLAALRGSDAYLFGGESGGAAMRVCTGGEHSEPDGGAQDAFTAAAMRGAGLAKKTD